MGYDGTGTFLVISCAQHSTSGSAPPTARPPRTSVWRSPGFAEHRGWEIVQTYEDAGISGAKGRDQRPAFNQMLKDAVRGRFGMLMVWSIDRLGRSVLHVASAMAEMDSAGVALYSDQQAIDSTSPFGKAMMQMACVFGELEREMIRARVRAGLNRVREQGLKTLGRPKGRGYHPPATWRRSRNPQGVEDGRIWQRHGAAGEEGDGGNDGSDNGRSGVITATSGTSPA
jgi:hypothetical protein